MIIWQMVVSSPFGNDLHYTLILEAVQAWSLVSNSGNSCQEGLQNAFPGADAAKQIRGKLAVADA